MTEQESKLQNTPGENEKMPFSLDGTSKVFPASAEVRLADESDIDQIITWGKRAVGADFTKDTEEYRADLLEMLENERFYIRIISENGQDLGWVLEEGFRESVLEDEVLEVLDDTESNVDTSELIDLCRSEDPDLSRRHIDAIELTEEARGHKLGQRAMEILLDGYRSEGVDLVTLHTQVENEPMKRLAVKMGFSLVLIPAVKGSDGQPVDDRGRVFAMKKL